MCIRDSDQVAVDLGKNGGDFVFQRGISQRQIFLPTTLNSGPLLKEEEEVDRNHHKAEQKSGDAKETADAGFEQVPEFVGEIRELALKVGQKFLDCFLDVLALRGTELR